MFVGTVSSALSYVQHGVVVDLARDGDLLLGLGQLRLELLEVLGRTQLRVGLSDREQASDRSRQHVLGLRLLGDALRLLRRGPRLRDLVEGAALVGRVALHRLDEVRDQVVAPPQLDVDLGPAVLGAVAQPDEPVVDRDRGQRHDQDEHDEDDHPDHVSTLNRGPVIVLPCGSEGLWFGSSADGTPHRDHLERHAPRRTAGGAAAGARPRARGVAARAQGGGGASAATVG